MLLRSDTTLRIAREKGVVHGDVHVPKNLIRLYYLDRIPRVLWREGSHATYVASYATLSLLLHPVSFDLVRAQPTSFVCGG